MMGKKQEIRKKKTQQRGLGSELSFLTRYSIILLFHYFERILFSLFAVVFALTAWAQVCHALDPLLVYTNAATTDTIFHRTYTTSWQGETAGPDPNDANLVWHVAKTGPAGREHVALAASYTNSALYAALYSGSSWSGGGAGTYKNLGTLPDTDHRLFAAAYEQASGDLLIVAATASNQISYWVWNGSSWVVDGATYTFTTLTSANKQLCWIEMASKPGSDEIALVAVDGSSEVVGLIWNGGCNSWSDENKLGTSTLYDTNGMDVEYMQSSGQALFVWGSSTTLYSWTWTGSAWEGSSKSKTGFGGNIRWVCLAAKPGSNDMLAAAFTDNSTTYSYQTINWVGASSAWGSTIRTPSATTLGYLADNRPFDLIFDGSGNALFVYSPSSTSGLYYRVTANITADWPAASYVDSVNTSNIDCYWVDLARATDGTVHLACQDLGSSVDQLLAYSWNGSSWSSMTTIQASIYKGPSNHAWKNFSLSIQPAAGSLVIAQTHYRWRNDNGPETGSIATVDASSGTAALGSFVTFSHVVSGSNRLLLVGISYYRYAADTAVTSVTWNGQNLTLVGSETSTIYARTEIWRLVAPETGTYNIQVSFTNRAYAVIGAVSFTGVHQTVPLGTYASAVGSSSSPSTNVSSASGDLVFGVVSSYGSDQTSNNANTTHWNTNDSTYVYGEGVTKTGAESSTTLSWTMGSSNYWSCSGVAVKPAVATFPLAEDAMLGVAKQTTWRLRFLVSNAGTGTTGALQYQLQVAETATCCSGTYFVVGGSGDGADWAMTASANFADGDATANITSGLTDPGGYTFVAGQLKESTNQTGNITLAASQFTEIEYSIQAASGATTGGDYCFRLYNATGGSALNSYTYAQARVLGATAVRSILLHRAHGRRKCRPPMENRLRGGQPRVPYLPRGKRRTLQGDSRADRRLSLPGRDWHCSHSRTILFVDRRLRSG